MKHVLFQTETMTWLDFESPGPEDLHLLKSVYKIDALILADSLEVGHLPKYEHLDNWEFLIVRFYSGSAAFYQNILRNFSSKIAVFFSENVVITIHQSPVPFLSKVVDMLDRPQLPDKISYKRVVYHLLTETFYSYEASYKKMTDDLEVFENKLFLSNKRNLDLKKLYHIKREANVCKKILFITKDSLDEYLSYHKKQAYIQDVYELNQKTLHLFSQVADDTQNLLNMYISIASQRSNEIMKLLTIFSAFFLPLTFIVGVYGMNFKNMPELEWPWGYGGSWVVMLLIVAAIYIWFKRKKIL